MAEPKPSVAELLAQYEESRPKALDERFTQPVPPEAGPFQQIIPEEETYRDMAERTLAGMLGDDRQAFRRAGKLLDTADQLPILGDASAGIDVIQAIKDVDPAGMGIAAAGVVPGGKQMLGKVRDFLKEKFTYDRTPQYPTETFPRHRMQPLPPEDPEVKYDPFRESFEFEKNLSRQAASFPEYDKERLKRAKDQGFNTDQVLYHYTTQFEKGPDGKPGELTTIKPSKSGTYGPGVYLSPDPFYAQRYALDAKDVKKFGEGARAIPVVVRGKLANTADFVDAMNEAQKEISKITKTFSPEKIKIAADDILRQKGFSGKQVNMYGENEFVVFDPKDIRSINAEFDPAAKDSAEILKAKGGMVTNMNRPVMSRGLSNLIRNYSQGPLARLDVPRETVPVQRMFNGGMAFNFDPFATGRELTEREEEVQAQMAAEALADDAPLPPIPLNQAQQQAYKADLLQMDDLGYGQGYGQPENNEFLYIGDTSADPYVAPVTPTVTQSQGTSGTGDTSPIEDGPASPPIQETIADAPLSDPTVPFTPPPPPSVEKVEDTLTPPPPPPPPPVVVNGTPPLQQPQQPQQPVGTGRTPDQVMADRAAEEAALAEAERIRLANLAAQEQLAAEQLAAQQQVAQDNLVPVPPVEPTPADTLEQELAQELADQATTQLAAQQNLDSQVLGAEQLVDQQAADRALLEAQLANQDDPTAVFQAPPSDTVDRSQFGVPVAPVDMGDPSVTYRTENNRLDSSHPFYQSDIYQNAPPYGTMDMYTASDGTEFGSSTTGALYEQWLQSQGVNPNVNFDVADKIDPYTTGYAPTLGMDIKETVYPYQGMTEQEMQDQGVYRAQVFQPMPKLSFGSGTQEGEEGEEGDDTEQTATGMPKLDFGSTTSGSGTKGRYVTLPTGQSIFVPDYGDLSFNTENPESEPGQYGLRDEQRYQCPAYYTLAFEGGQPYCKKIDKSQWPSGGRRRVQVANLPSRTAVSIIEPKEPGSETGEGYAQGGPVQNFSLGGMALHQAQMAAMRRGAQGPFGQAMFQRFQNTSFVPPPQPQPQKSPSVLSQFKQKNPVSDSYYESPEFHASMARAGQLMGVGPTPDVSMGNPIMDQQARGNISTRGPESFGQMGPPQQIGQVAEPNTQQLASQLQNVTQQVNQLSSHLGVSGGGISQGPSQLNQLQGGIGGLLQNLRPGPPPPQLRTTGPVRPPMLVHYR